MEVAYIDPIAVAIPDNEDRKVTVASMPAFLTMKAIALDRRDALKKAKDAYDIVYCLRNYPNGLDEIAKQFSEEKGNPLITHGIRLLTKMFDSVDALGPTAYAQRAVSSEDAALLKREAVERIRRLLLKIELG
jgi:predicted nucleotidyltransferase